jgi:hypothetical protein
MFIGINDRDTGAKTINVNKIVGYWVNLPQGGTTIEMDGDRFWKATETVDEISLKIRDCMLAKARLLNLLNT